MTTEKMLDKFWEDAAACKEGMIERAFNVDDSEIYGIKYWLQDDSS